MSAAESARVVPVILAGGVGSRLWPVSRPDLPKQFSPVFAGGTLFERTLARVAGPPFAAPLVVTGARFADLARQQAAAAGLPALRLLLEPEGRNTAPAVAAALEVLAAEDPEALLLVLPSDHLVRDDGAFRRAVLAAIPIARAGHVVLFGVRPDRVEPGFGHIELPGPAGPEPQPFLRFVEKPPRERAAAMVASGRFLWNAGLFLFRADAMRSAFERHAPAILAGCRAALAAGERDSADLARPDPGHWCALPSISLDHAVMEPLGRGWVVPLACGWDDLGSWRTVWRAMPRDEAGVAARGRVAALECRDSLLLAAVPGMAIGAVGLEAMAVVATARAVLAAPLERAGELGALAAALAAACPNAEPGAEPGAEPAAPAGPSPEIAVETWGRREVLAAPEGLTLARLLVSPGATLAVAAGEERAWWLVVAGALDVERAAPGRSAADAPGRVSEGAATDGPQALGVGGAFALAAGERARLRNPGCGSLELLELRLASGRPAVSG